MSTILLTVASISSWVLHNTLQNKVCKSILKTQKQINAFNVIVYMICLLFFGILLFFSKISLYTILFGIIFGGATTLSTFYRMRALTQGPMHITLLITTSSMLIPTLSGLFFGERFNLTKFIFAIILLGFIYLSLDRSSAVKINRKWFFFCILAFFCQGTIGVVQKVHQTSQHKNEIGGFLFIAFMCCFIISFLRSKNGVLSLGVKTSLIAVACGVCTFLMNVINLKLTGILPSQLFFPIVSGSSMVLSSFVSIVVFKEKFSAKQLVGFVGGLICLIAICIV